MTKAGFHRAARPLVKQNLPLLYARFDTRLGHYKANVVTEADL